MGVVVAVLAVWSALSVLFALVHRRWVFYGPARDAAWQLRSRRGSFVRNRRDTAHEGADVSEFFRSWEGGAIARPSRGILGSTARP